MLFTRCHTAHTAAAAAARVAILIAISQTLDLQAAPPEPLPATPLQQPAPQAGGAAERLTEQHNVRIRPSIKSRLGKAVDKLRYETGDRTISIASITDQALDAYLTQHGC